MTSINSPGPFLGAGGDGSQLAASAFLRVEQSKPGHYHHPAGATERPLETTAMLAELLTECAASGIRLLLPAEGKLVIDAPREALVPELLARLKHHKGELLQVLQSSDSAPADSASFDHGSIVAQIPWHSEPTQNDTQTHTHEKAIDSNFTCRCGSTTWRDVSIHGGRSIRRDCCGCGRFLEFPSWYGTDALLNE